MPEEKKHLDEQVRDKADEIKSKGTEKYEKLIDRLYQQRNNLRRELDREYNEARRYVRSNPEEGMLIGLIGGFVIGIVLSRWFK